jgi:DNA invertase Pin-like site-specific DNA recombinase
MSDKIKNKIIQKLKDDNEAQLKIALATGFSQRTIQRWIANSEIYLTTETVVKTIMLHYGIQRASIIDSIQTPAKKRKGVDL